MSIISEEEKLAWGDFDFIEESASFSATPLNFEEISDITISEAKAEKSPFKLLGRVCGCIAPVGSMSRNGRLYEESHWPKILSNPDLQERIASRKFFGMISHENCPINDRNFKAGEISHVCSLLEVRNDNNGKPYLYGELDILDTPAGRILKAMYEGGAGLYVSTRAAGKILESVRDGKPIKVVDSSSYYINSIDFVLNPGFLQAKPVYEGIKESEEVNEARKSESEKAHDKWVNEPANWSKEPNKECEYRKAKYEEAAKKHGDLKVKTGDYNSETPEVKKAGDEVTKAYKELEQARKAVYPNYKALESSEIETLKSQIDRLAKIVEKVVDDVYEEPTSEAKEEAKEKELEKKPEEAPQMQEQPIAPVKEALADFVSLMADTNISEKAFEEIVDIIAKAKENK